MPPTDLAELRRLHEAATKGENWQEAVLFAEACKLSLPALLDELEAAREEVREVQNGAALRARDRRMKLLGSAEELERISANWYQEMVAWTATDFEQQAATLRQEAEGK